MKNTAEKLEEICGYLATGLTREDACDLAGVHRATFYRWLKNATFATLVNQAELKNKHLQIVRVQTASSKDWRAGAWWLERKYPKEFGAKHMQEHSGKIDFVTAMLEMAQNHTENLTDKASAQED